MLAVHPIDVNRECAAAQPSEPVAPTLQWLETPDDCGGGIGRAVQANQTAASPPLDVDAPSTLDGGRFSPTPVQPKSDGTTARAEGWRSVDDDDEIDTSFEIALLSDYRRGGLTKSGGDPALQISFDIEEPSGWNIGVSVTTIEERKGAHAEVSLYGAKAFEFGDTELTLGATALIFPGGEHSDFGIAQLTLSHPLGPLDLTLAVNYAWEQANIDDEDNLSVSVRARSPIGRFLGVPLTAGASVGRSEGPLAIEDVKHDWSLSLTADVHGTDIGLTYVDTDLEDERGDATCVLSIVRTF